MGKAIISLILLLTPGWALAVSPAAVKDNAPDRYVVVEGDTLWGIAGRFLQNPWQWPEIWKLNQDQIKNPNRIYPGDVIVLDRSAHEASLRLVKLETVRLEPRIRAESIAKPIPTITPATIEPFLSKPLIVGENELDPLPRITATQENRVTVGAGAIVYASGLTPEKGNVWQIYRRGDPLVDPDSNSVLGYVAIFVGEARVLKFGEESTLEITRSPREIYAGDRLVPAGPEVANFGYVPHAPQKPVKGKILSDYAGLGGAGPLQIVTLSKGSKDGVEVGHVLAIYRNQAAQRYELRTSPLYGRSGLSGSNSPRTYYQEQLTPRDVALYDQTIPITESQLEKLPDERYGLVMVFRTFDRASFGIVMQASRPVQVNDVVANP